MNKNKKYGPAAFPSLLLVIFITVCLVFTIYGLHFNVEEAETALQKIDILMNAIPFIVI
ncbi:MAG: hypothetical protein GY679_01850 [Mycoplasma sp.]|nr:hypothetical protein [Mycoplasma sp.]